MISIIAASGNKKTLLKLDGTRQDFRAGIRRGFFEIAAKNEQDATRAIEKGKKTGRVYRIRGRRHRASAPGEAPANLSGQLKNSLGSNISGSDRMEFGYKDSAEHGKFLEEGTSRMAARPNIEPTVRNNERNAQVMISSNINKRLKK